MACKGEFNIHPYNLCRMLGSCPVLNGDAYEIIGYRAKDLVPVEGLAPSTSTSGNGSAPLSLNTSLDPAAV